MKIKVLLLMCFIALGVYGFENSGIFFLRNGKLIDTKPAGSSIGFQYDNGNYYLLLNYKDLVLKLDKKDRALFLYSIEKYEEWSEIAKTENIDLEKEITNSNTMALITARTETEDSSSWDNYNINTLSYNFSSKSGKYNLVLEMSYSNKNYNLGNTLTFGDNPLWMKEYLDDEKLAKLIEKYKQEKRKEATADKEKQEKIDTLFN